MNLKQIIAESNPSQSHTEMSQMIQRIIDYGKEVKVVLEIGVHRGGSFRVWQRVFKPELIIGLDNSMSGIQDILDEIQDDPAAHILVPVDSTDPGTVETVKSLLEGRTIDFLFIDGDHTYKGVKADWELYSPFLSEKAAVGFHDINITDREDIGVYKLWKELGGIVEYYYPEEQGTGTGVLFL